MIYQGIIPKLNFILFILFIHFAANTCSQKIEIQFAPPDNTIFYQNTNFKKTSNYDGTLHKGEMTIQGMNKVNKTTQGYLVDSKLINSLFYWDDERVDLPFITTLTNMSIQFSLDTKGDILDIQGLDGWDEGIRQSVPPRLFEIYKSLFGADVIKNLMMKESQENTDYYLLPLGAPIRLPSIVKSREKILFQGKNCVRTISTHNTKIKSHTFDPGPVVQQWRKRQNLPPIYIHYSGIEITGSSEEIVDPTTSLPYYGKSQKKLKLYIESQYGEKYPISIDEYAESKFDYPKP